MIKYQQKLLFIVVITALLLSVTTVAFANAEEANDRECSHMEKNNHVRKAIRPHFNFYYQLLAEKYAPNHVKVWNEVLKDREGLYKKYKELKKEGKEVDSHFDEAWQKDHVEIHQLFLEAVEKRDDTKLKEIVPRLIDHQKELNSLLKRRIKELN